MAIIQAIKQATFGFWYAFFWCISRKGLQCELYNVDSILGEKFEGDVS